MKKAVACSFCGEELDNYQAESPMLDPNDKLPVCDECYHEKFEFTCCGCQEYGDVAEQHKFLVVFEEGIDTCGPTLAPGLYRIVEFPYWANGMIEGHLYSSSLKLLRPLPIRWFAYRSITGKRIFRTLTKNKNPLEYPCGHLCLECQQALKLEKVAGKVGLRKAS